MRMEKLKVYLDTSVVSYLLQEDISGSHATFSVRFYKFSAILFAFFPVLL